MSPDGSYMIYVSVRPMSGGSAAPGTDAGKDAKPKKASHVWRVNRTGSGWSAPVELPEAVNFCQLIFRPSVAADGSVYFTAAGQGKELRLFRSQYENGAYRKAEPLSFSDGNLKDVDPEIAPDQSFVVFASIGRGTVQDGHEKLFVSKNNAGAWTAPMPLRYADDDANGSSDDNDPRLGADRLTVYFSSDRSVKVDFPRAQQQAAQDFKRMQLWDNGNGNIWVISLKPWLGAGKR